MPQNIDTMQCDYEYQQRLMEMMQFQAQAQNLMGLQNYNQAQNLGLMQDYRNGLMNQLAAYAPRLAEPRIERAITIGKAPEVLFWHIPAVAYLVEKIPAARHVIKPDGITATYLAEAKAAGYPLKKQCEDLGIPWTARLLTASESRLSVIKAASFLAPSVFAQTKACETWGNRLCWLFERGARPAVIEWAARHIMALPDDARDYLLTLETIASTTKAKTIADRNREWHANVNHERTAAQYGFRLSDRAKSPHGIEKAEYAGYEFHAMVSFDDFYKDGQEQRHCITSRFGGALAGSRYYFSIRKDGKRLATAEYDLSGNVLELKSFANGAPPMAVKMAANAFRDIIQNGPPVEAKPAELPQPKRLKLPFHWPKKVA